MATHRIFVPATAFEPDTSGNVYPKPSAIDDTNDRFSHELLAFADSGTKIAASVTFAVPKNYVGTPKAYVVWKSTATSGDAFWTVASKAVAAGESLDPSTDDDAQNVTTTTNGTALTRTDSAVTLTGTYAPDDLVLLSVARDGTQGTDTLAAEALFEGAFFEYADA